MFSRRSLNTGQKQNVQGGYRIVAEAALGGLLLSAAKINTAMGATGMKTVLDPGPLGNAMNKVSPEECRPGLYVQP